MVCGNINEGFDNMCNFCGCFGGACCGEGRERCCDCCNHCFCFGPICCECCPCGANGCIGYPNHLCGCCGNCNLMWYSGCCPCCFIADLYIATDTANDKNQEWSNIVCNVVLLNVLMFILQALAGAVTALRILQNVSSIIELIEFIYLSVVFGYAATKIAKAKGFNYEAEECCTKCYEQGCCSTCGRCCSSCSCCCAYYCCFENHWMQVARTLEKDDKMQRAIMDGRPSECRCCNCWETAEPLELTTATGTDRV